MSTTSTSDKVGKVFLGALALVVQALFFLGLLFLIGVAAHVSIDVLTAGWDWAG